MHQKLMGAPGIMVWPMMIVPHPLFLLTTIIERASEPCGACVR